MKKKIVATFLSLTLCLQIATPAFAQVTGVSDSTASIGGNTAKIVKIDMSQSGRFLDIAISDGKIHNDTQTSSLINQTSFDTVAGINGGFFNSYYSGTPTYPNNYPVVYGSVVKDGKLITGLGETNAIGITANGEILIDRVNLQVDVIFNDNSHKAGVWAVGSYNKDGNAVSILTSEFPYSVKTESGSKVFTVRDNKIVSVAESGNYTVPANSSLLIYNQTVANNVSQWGQLPKVGDTVSFNTYAKASSITYDTEKWNNIDTAVSGGRFMLKDGVNVTSNTSYNGSFDSDSKQTASSVLQRSFVATMGDGSLIFGTVNGSFNSIATYLVSIGAVNAMSLDGGASSMLYTKDKGFITPAGRKLATALVVVDGKNNTSSTGGTSATIISGTTSNQSTNTTSNNNTPSSWATEHINKASANGLIPEYLQFDYRKNITRQEFCVLVVKLIEKKTGNTIDAFRNKRGIEYASAFADTDDYFIRQCSSLGIVLGANNKFRPNDTITREEAAVILHRTLDTLDIHGGGTPKTFTDSNEFSSWAVESIGFVTKLGVMNGVGDAFNPKGMITREQVYITMQNIYGK